MIILRELLMEITTMVVDNATDEYTLIHSEYYNHKDSVLVIIDQRNSEYHYLRSFRGRLYAGAYNPLERKDEDSFFQILDNLQIVLGEHSLYDRYELTEKGKHLLTSIPYLFVDNVNGC